MKRTDLEKLNGLKLRERMKGAGTPARFGAASGSGRHAAPARSALLDKLLGSQPGTGQDQASGDDPPAQANP